MRKAQKSREFNLFGYTVLIRVTYPAKLKSTKKLNVHSFFNIVSSFVVLSLIFIAGVNISTFLPKESQPTSTIYFPDSVYRSLLNPKKEIAKKQLSIKEKIVFHGPRTKKQVALSFDGDMTPEMKYDLESGFTKSYYDRELIKILTETGTKATLFLSGMWIESYPNETRELSLNPLFELANHTYSHPAFEGACYGLSLALEEQKQAELEKTQKLLKEVTGEENKLFRFPGGCYSQSDLDLVSSTGQVTIQWDVAGQDGFNSNTANIVSNVVDNVRNGSIVVLHMNGYPNEPVTVEALPLIITAIRSKGFELVTISELLGVEEKAFSSEKFLSSIFLLPI